MKDCKTNRGFTTLELAIVIIIFGMMMTGVLTAFKFYIVHQREAQTEAAFEASEVALQAFVSNKRHYPCPAAPDIARGDLNYGREQVDGAGACTATNGVIRVPVPRDQNEDGTNDWVLIGSVPFNSMLDPNGDGNMDDGIPTSIPLTDALTYDGFGNRLTYAVTETLTDPLKYNDAFGTIMVVDEHDTPLITEKEDLDNDGTLDPGEDKNGNLVLDAGLYAHTVLISHGDNGRGATTAAGQEVEACPPSLPAAVFPEVATAVNEIENCDPDGKFLNGLRYESGPSRNDDIIKFQIMQTSGLWSYVQGSDSRIMNTNGGNVGFGTEVPSQKLEIAGRLRADDIQSNEYCDINNNDICLEANALGGDLPSMKCDPGEVIVSVEENAVRCEPAFDGSFTPRTCAPGCHATGFRRDASGNTSLICRNSSNTEC
jgi:type II secretory pathway pseudopilin PulG